MKKCPYCAEDINIDAIKCRFCGEFLIENQKIKKRWYFKTSSLFVSFLCFGPLSLPLLWINPHISKNKKIITTVLVLILTYILVSVLENSVKTILDYYKLIFEQMSG